MRNACLFPGQGTQRRGMGSELFAQFPDLTGAADEILGLSVSELCLTDPHNRLSSTRYCQPALYTVCCLSFLQRGRDRGWPDVVAGHSLGEFSALFAAGVLDFEAGLELVKRRGEIMAGASRGSMLAVIGLGEPELCHLLSSGGAPELEIATYNLPDQHVVSGPDGAVHELAELLAERHDVRTVHLHINGAFHSRHSEDAAEQFAAVIDAAHFRDPVTPVISNVTARPYEPGRVKSVLAQQMRSPVRWAEVMGYLQRAGVRTAAQVGPGRVLDGLWARSGTEYPVGSRT